jgi:hypothetical protein
MEGKPRLLSENPFMTIIVPIEQIHLDVTLYISICELLGSKLGRDTGYFEGNFS